MTRRQEMIRAAVIAVLCLGAPIVPIGVLLLDGFWFYFVTIAYVASLVAFSFWESRLNKSQADPRGATGGGQPPRSLRVRIARGLALIMFGWMAAGTAFSPEFAHLSWSYWPTITGIISAVLLVNLFVDLLLQVLGKDRGPAQRVEDGDQVGL
ncbi:hypothetical protein GCM10023194_22300 [Planotetraspora phitsanulokensis]|uniref:Uncharacterized protein n=1 Tax=Planotetraspora phitsanulokensis TaxID=575192 RepID=A0A8J3XEB0_9ACTN|nr:hypothetical protein [Planotetraspora phitsanulokensis]GII38287.1 hypothetical protein Pph01_32900 [Planotetraspora phitsanulokensis]